MIKRTEVLDFDPNLVDIDQQVAFIEFSPKNITGSTTGRIRHFDTSDPNDHSVSEVLVRIRVHDDVDDFWIGNNQVTIHKDESNYVLSVNAKFDDGSFGDISAHRYLDYSNAAAADAAFVVVDNADDKGRITGKQETTGGPKRIDVQLGNTTRSIDVNVTKPLNTPNRILECVFGSANFKTRRNILIISEGFTQAQKDVFDTAVNMMVHELLLTRNNSPYNLLSGKLNVWRAFDPSPEEGIGVGYPVSKNSGRPISPNTATDPAIAPDFRMMQARDSRFGMIYGSRYGDRNSELVDPANAPNVNKWFLPARVIRSMGFDRRRNRSDWNYSAYLNDYLDSLEVNPARHSGPQFANISDVWKSGGDDNELVCFLANDDRDGGTRGGDIFGLRLALKQDRQFNSLIVNGDKLDHMPDAPTLKRLNLLVTTVALPLLDGTNMAAVTSTLAHEFGHSLGLGDSYETIDPGRPVELLQNNTQGIDRINADPNLTHHWLVKDANGKIDFNEVVWNKWIRVSLSATLTAPAANVGNKVEVSIDPNDANEWLVPVLLSANVFLRTRDIDFVNNSSNNYIEGPFQLEPVSLTGNITLEKLTLRGNITKNFPADSVIYVAKERGGTPLPLIEPLVAKFITNNNNGEPFAKKADCNKANRSPSQAPNIPGLIVADQRYVVAVYEGGGLFNCKVYRPCGQCRMRDDDTLQGGSFPPFCPVCKYHLVNSIHPEKLGRLEQEYPTQEPTIP